MKITKDTLPPVNDPSRVCWQFLSDVIDDGRRFSPPPDPELAGEQLKALLVLAYETNPEALIMKSCHPVRLKGKKTKLDSYLADHPDGLAEICSRLYHQDSDAQTGQIRDQSKSHSARLQQWEITQMGSSEIKAPVNRGPSAMGISYYDPTQMGVGGYIQARVGHILQTLGTEATKHSAEVSFDALGEKGVDITAEGTTVRQVHDHNEASDELPDLVEDERAASETSYQTTFKHGAAGRSEEPIEEEDNDPTDMEFDQIKEKIALCQKNLSHSEADTPATKRIQSALDSYLDEAASRIRADAEANFVHKAEWTTKLTPENADSLSRPEFSYFASVLPPSKSTVNTEVSVTKQLRSKAITLLKQVKGAIGEDYDVINEDIKDEWDPLTESFFHRYNDLVSMGLDSATTAAYNEKCKEEVPELYARETAESAAQLCMFTSGKSPQKTGDDFRDNMNIANENVRVCEVWNARAVKGEQLNYAPRRVDYIHFCEGIGEEPNLTLEGSALHAEVKVVARKWIEKTASFNSGEFISALDEYDPANDGYFTEVIREIIGNIIKNATQPAKQPAKAPGSRINDSLEFDFTSPASDNPHKQSAPEEAPLSVATRTGNLVQSIDHLEHSVKTPRVVT